MPSSRGSSPPKDQTHVSYVSCTGRRVSTTRATWEAQENLRHSPSYPRQLIQHNFLQYMDMCLRCSVYLLECISSPTPF